jgi:hypothetical protein
MRKILTGLAAAVVVAAPLALVTSPADAADGDQILNINFDTATPSTLLTDLGETTDFSHTTFLGQATDGNRPAGSMWDPGTYVIGSNPNAFHEFWANYDGGDNMLIVNGNLSLDQKVLEASATGTVCDNPLSQVRYTFGANMTNILPLSAASDGGAAISVFVNNQLIGSQTVLSNDPANQIAISGSVVPAANMTVKIVNDGTAYSGNDFAIDDITLTQSGECIPPCKDEIKGVWHNYTGNFTKNGLDANHDGIPDLNDPLWKVHSNTPGGEHDFATRGVNKPYRPGKANGNGDWFYWSDEGAKCAPAA